MGSEEIERLQRAYTVAARKLQKIASHHDMTTRGNLGYFMSLENITLKVKTLNPKRWYENEKCKNRAVTFNDLPPDDQKKLTDAMNELQGELLGEFDLIEKCQKCGQLCTEFCNKVIELGKERRKVDIESK